MGDKLIVGPIISKGLKTNVLPFAVDNDSFPILINAFQWRGRVKRKRGTSLLNRLRRYFDSDSTVYNSGSATITLSGAGVGNILTGFGLQLTGNIIPGTVTITVGANTYTDPGMDGTLSPSGTIIYSTGVITIPAEAGNAASALFSYYPSLPVMGFRDFQINSTQFPGNLAFDTTYSYNVITAYPYTAYDVSFYKNAAVDSTDLPGYTPKTDWTRLQWNGQNYQQFFTVNYQGAFWASNVIEVPFDPTNKGMQYKFITGVSVIPPPGNGTTVPAVAELTIVAHGLVVGDFVFVNEVEGITGINFQTGYVTDVIDVDTVEVTFPFAILGGAYTANGIAQYLTNNSDPTKDCIRWYDGDPTDGNVDTPGFIEGRGWVNFMPPLSRDLFSIADLPPAQYYLVGAKVISVYKDRLLFFGPVVQRSNGTPIYLQDTVVFSQNGTPYYTTSFFYDSAAPDDPTLETINFHPILLPENQTSTAPAWFEDQTGFGGFLSAGLDEPIFTVGSNEDALIVGFDSTQTRLVYTGNDIIPFLFYVINSELGSGSTFSLIQMDQGVITRGDRGIVITGQTQTQRIDLEVPDEVFQMKLIDNGSERICSARDFINEWVYFTYPANNINWIFPTQTLFYNYRDNSWGIFRECFTCYGQFNRITGFIWSTVGLTYPTWSVWNDPWNAGESTLLQPKVVGGNQQGFLLAKNEGTGEGTSLYIESFNGNTVNSTNHCLNDGDYIIITGALGEVGDQVNGKIFSVYDANITDFKLNPGISSATYFGGALITRMYVPQIQTKQFPAYWNQGKKCRIGVQQYLLDTTPAGKITLQIFLSQNQANPYNFGPIVPDPNSVNNSLIYSALLYTCPESTNLGLSPYTINLQSPNAIQQDQIWHRMNTSLIGDTVQVGFTMSDAQMREIQETSMVFEITGATQSNPCVLTCEGQFESGSLIKISGVSGMTELNGNIYYVISSNSTQVTIQADSTAFSAYVSGGIATQMTLPNQFEEIVVHGFTMDLSPSGYLA